MKSWVRGVIITAVAAVSGKIAVAGSLTRVWDLNIDERGPGATGDCSAPLAVFALIFSPDGQRIAAVVGRSTSEQFILVLAAGAPQNRPEAA